MWPYANHKVCPRSSEAIKWPQAQDLALRNMLQNFSGGGRDQGRIGLCVCVFVCDLGMQVSAARYFFEDLNTRLNLTLYAL